MATPEGSWQEIHIAPGARVEGSRLIGKDLDGREVTIELGESIAMGLAGGGVHFPKLLPTVGPFTEYIWAAMRHATFKPLEDGTIWGEIAGLQGVWANAASVDACRMELQSVLEDWIMVGIALHHPIPPVDGIELRVGQAA